jgi:hypothetical protein
VVDEDGVTTAIVHSKMVAAATVWRRALDLNTAVQTLRLTDGPTRFKYFPNYPNWLKLVKSKWMPYSALKIPKFCMRLEGSVLNNFLNCADFK